MLVRFYSVRQDSTTNKAARYVNNGSIFLGFISLAGMIVVAAYPINTKRGQGDWKVSIAIPHTIGAFSTFIVGVCYAICQTSLTFILRMKSQFNSLLLVAVRTLFCVCATVSVMVMILYKSGGTNSSDIQNGTTTTPAAQEWMSSADTMGKSIAEWVLALMLMCFFLSMYPELKYVRLTTDIENVEETSSAQHLNDDHQEYGAMGNGIVETPKC